VELATIERLLSTISDWVWGPPLLLLLFGTHLFLTVRLRVVQTYLPRAIRLSFERKREGAGDISHFGALMTALAATIGTGNIVGVATAVAAGGPGAVLWMWLTGVFGIATKYGEAVLSVRYRVTTARGEMAGGPMYVLERGLGARWLGLVFAALTAVAAVVILGGVRSIARVCEWLVPFMAVFYVLGCLALLVHHAAAIPETIRLILTSAFTGHAAVGGFLGAGVRDAIRYGIARGLFSNESGLGSAPIIAAAAQTTNPVRQALVSSTGTF
jgi:alanine or glycine:cation symporter, AGCS family